jgi:hypothetical protein
LVQPLLHSIAKDGEWPMVFFGGKFSHAANKRVSLPRAGTVDDLFAAETNTAHFATLYPCQLVFNQGHPQATGVDLPSILLEDTYLLRDWS